MQAGECKGFFGMKVAVLISGGVDSSVALRLLQEEGHEITAFYLKIWLEDELSYLGSCPWEEDLAIVRQVCEQAGVPLEVISLQHEYWDIIVNYTIASVKQGRTPSPDILCNQYIKFGAFYNAIGNRFEKIATGHYASIEQVGDLVYLKKAVDPIKDQTYFLSRLSQAQLARLLFPLGPYPKSEVRAKALKYDLVNKERRDSQGICFLGKFKFSDFIKHHVGVQEGDLVEYETNRCLGKHEGFWYYTIGQRKGIKLGAGPWYVVAKDVARNIVYISSHYYEPDKLRDTIAVGDITWLTEQPREYSGIFQIKIRHGEAFYEAAVEFFGAAKERANIKLSTSDQGIAPGQFVVFYKSDVCLGAGIIEEPAPGVVW